MASFFSRIFGKRGETPSGYESGGKIATQKVSVADQSGKHVAALGDSEWDRPSDKTSEDGDTGPWHIGKTVGEIFEIRGVLGRGGMGIVYRAFDNATRRDIAVKVPLSKFVEDETARKLFAKEGETWTRMIHPNIVHAFNVHDDQTTGYRPAIFMDYCDGGSLADRLHNGGQISLSDGLDIAIQTCWAMEFAHNKGNIHRDLKPGNVLLDSGGKAMVTDFGLAKLLEDGDLAAADSDQPGPSLKATATFTAGAAGTPAYMPPEQWIGQTCKESDIYAFGIIMYELFCGCRPFSGDDATAMRTAHLKVPPPEPKHLNGQIPNVLSALMLSCLSKDSSNRLASFAEVAVRLNKAYQQLHNGQSHSTRRHKPAKKEISEADKKVHAVAMLRIGNGCKLRSDLAEASHCYDKALEIFQNISEQAGMSACYTSMGILAYNCGNYDEAMELYRKALFIDERLDNQAGMGKCYTNMGTVAYGHRNYKEAMELYRKSLAIFERLDDQAGVGSSYTGMGIVAKERGKYDKAMEFYRKALVIKERLSDLEEVAYCNNNMGEVARARGNFDEAIELYGKSLTIHERLGNQAGMGFCYNNMGEVARARGNFDEAIELSRKALAIKEKLGDLDGISGCYNNMGNISFARGNYDKAMELYGNAVAIGEQLDNQARIGGCYTNMGAVAKKCGNYDESMELYRKALVIFERLGDQAGMRCCYNNMCIVAEARGSYDEAIPLLKKAKTAALQSGDVGLLKQVESIQLQTQSCRAATTLESDQQARTNSFEDLVFCPECNAVLAPSTATTFQTCVHCGWSATPPCK